MPLRHERRRRSFADDSLVNEEDEASPPRDAGGANSRTMVTYAPGARLDRQRRIHDILPARHWTIAAALVGTLTLVGMMTLGHVWAEPLAGLANGANSSALLVNGARNVTQWFASMLLGFESLVAIFIYSLRRHRVDDYHGRYRVWIWTTIGCLLASLGETTDVGLLVHGVCRRCADLCSFDETLFWHSLCGALAAIIAIRLLIEVRKSRVSVAAMVLASTSFLLATAVEYEWFPLAAEVDKPLIIRGVWLIGYVLVLATFLLYARHVGRGELDGLVAASPPRRKRPKSKADGSTNGKNIKIEPAHATSPHMRTDLDPVKLSTSTGAPRLQIGTTVTRPVSTATSSTAADGRGLSRAERRRLRREASRED